MGLVLADAMNDIISHYGHRIVLGDFTRGAATSRLAVASSDAHHTLAPNPDALTGIGDCVGRGWPFVL